MWTSRLELEQGGRVVRIGIDAKDRPLTYGQVIALWEHGREFAAMFSQCLADLPFTAFKWETPPLTLEIIGREFECVALDAPALARAADPEPFAEQLGQPTGSVVEFPNLGGDAIMVVPCPIGPEAAYAHLGAFVRQAPDEQRRDLSRVVGSAMRRRLGKKPVWLSTAGGGVAWLHVRLDDRPKYYGYAKYRA